RVARPRRQRGRLAPPRGPRDDAGGWALTGAGARRGSADFGSALRLPNLDLAMSYGSEGFGRGHAGGAQGGQQAGDGADGHGSGDAAGPGEGRDDDGPVLGGGGDGGGGRARGDPGQAAEDGEQDGFGQELDPDLPLGGAEGTAQADLGAAFQDGDDHDVGDPDAADQQGHRAEAEEQAVERAFG